MDKIVPQDMKESAIAVGQFIMERYWHPLYKYIQDNPSLINTVTGFLLEPEELIFYFGKTHLAIEYVGNEQIENLKNENNKVDFIIYDFTESKENFIENIVGFKSDATVPLDFPLPQYIDDLIVPTNKGLDKLIEMKWNFAAQNSIMTINGGKHYVPAGQFTRLINALFFDANEYGLKTRHIKWIDFVPLEYDNTKQGYDTISVNIGFFNESLVEHDAHFVYPLPDKNDFKFSKLPQLNRFIELIGNDQTSEPEITAFLNKEENQFILTMGFFSKQVFHQVNCEWQSEDKPNIIPDYFALQPNGFANIVEFKLPSLKSNTQTGRENRETFSAEINSYISQTRNYKTYFDDPNNRNWFEKKYEFKVFHPKRYLIMGRRWEFKSDDWKEIISDYRDIEILTYDDLIDGVVAQFYM
jgi:Domain of unknown function (DUF4263)